MKTEMKPSSTETIEKRMSSHTIFERKITPEQKLFPSSKRSNANGTQYKTENKIKIVDVKPSLTEIGKLNSELLDDEAL